MAGIRCGVRLVVATFMLGIFVPAAAHADVGATIKAPTSRSSGPVAAAAAKRAGKPVAHAAQAPACSWHDGTPQTNYATQIIVGGTTIAPHLNVWAGYCGAAGWPRIGDVFYVRVGAGLADIQNPDAPAMGLVFDGQFNDAFWAISQTNPVQCGLTSGSSTVDKTSDTAHCRQTPTPNISGLGWNFGFYPLATGQIYQIYVPIYVTHTKSGIGSGNAALFGNSTRPALGGDLLATQSLFVYDRPNEVTNPGTGEITASGVKTESDFYSYWRAGTATFEIGTGAGSYQASQDLAIDGSAVGAHGWASWANLSPGTVYHWRAKLKVGAATVVGQDQAFTTSGSASGGSPSIPVAAGSPGGDGAPGSQTGAPGTQTGSPGTTTPPAASSDPGGTSPSAPGPQPTSPPAPADTTPPTLKITGPRCSGKAKVCAARAARRSGWRTIAGNAADAGALAGVGVSVVLKNGRSCFVATTKGWKRTRCSAKPVFMKAQVGAGRWSLKLKAVPPTGGKLTAQARAIDAAGNVSPIVRMTQTLR